MRHARAALASVLILTFALVSWFTYRAVDRRVHLNLEQQLTALLQANEHGARMWFEGREAITRQLAGSTLLESAVRRLERAQGAEADKAREEIARVLLPLRHTGMIQHYFVVSASGTVRATSAPPELERALGSSPFFAELGRTRQSALIAPTAPREQGSPIPRGDTTQQGDGSTQGDNAASPITVLSSATIAGTTNALLILAFDPRVLTRLFEQAAWGETGEVYAFDRTGLMLTESRFTPEVVRLGLLPSGATRTALTLRLHDPGGALGERAGAASARELTKMAARATSGESATDVEGYRNYLGRPVLGAWTWLDEYGFGLATEVSVSDAFASTLVVRRAALLMLALMLTAAAGFALLGQWTLRLRRQSADVSRRLDRLARAIQPLSAALETDPTAVLLVNERLEVVYANPAASALLARPLEGAHVSDVLSRLPPALREALIDGQDTVVALGDDGTGDTLLVSVRELAIEGRLHALYMLRPVTQELRRQEVEHWKKLIRVLSHELNNSLAPITSLVSSARKLAEGTEREEPLDKIFSIIAERTQHLLDFLESYRSVARLPRPARVDVDWQEFVDGLRAQMRFEVAGPLPTRRGYFDPAQMERVLLNLLKNAHESGGPPEEVTLRIVDEEQGTRIDVLDRGTGMSRPVLEQATLPFYSTKRTGTGVGLALSREIVEAHRGRLTLANREGGGLVASVWLPPRFEPRLSTTW